MSDVVKIERDRHIMEVILNRPDSLNAINYSMAEGLFQAIDQAKAPDVRAVLIRGEGRNFCHGGDVALFAEKLKEGQGLPREVPDSLKKAVKAIHGLPKPVIAAVHGSVAGAGMSLVLACDLALASEDAKFNLAYVRLGVSPDGGASFFLPRHLGFKRAMEIFLMPRSLSATEACELGLINRVVPNDNLLQVSHALAARLANGPTTAFGNIKQLVKASFTNKLDEQLELESDLVCASSQTEDFQAGVTAFLAKITPQFTGK